VSHQAAGSNHGEDGTASVETVAAVPFLLLAVLVAAQLGLAGYALWSAAIAARAGARADLVGRDPLTAARRALPPALRDDAELREDGVVSVRVAIPDLLPVMPRVVVGAEAALESSDG